MKPKILFGIVCLFLAFSLSCSRCEKRGTATLAGLIPGDVAGVLLFPDLSATITDVNALVKKISVGPVASFVSQGKIELARLLGFDPFVVGEWNKIGVNPAKGLAIVLDPARTLVVVGISDKKAFEAETQKRMKELVAADQVSTDTQGGVTITSLGTRIGDRTIPRLRYAFAGGYALVTSAGADPDLLQTCASVKPDQSLSGAGWFGRLTGKVSKDADVLLLVNGPKAEAILRDTNPELASNLKEGLALAFAAAPDGLSLDGFLGLDAESAKKFSGFTTGVADAHLERLLPDDTFAALKVRINTEKLLDFLLEKDPEARAQYDQVFAQAKEAVGSDVRDGTVRNLSGNAVLGISLGKPEQINRLVASQGEENIGSAFRLLVWIQLKDGAAYAKIMDQAISTAGDQLPLTRSKAGPLQVLTFPGQQGLEFHVLHHQDLVGLCVGDQCTDAAAKMAGKEAGGARGLPAKLSPEAGKLFSTDSLLVSYLNFGQVLDAVSALDASAMGEGGMMVKMILDMAVSVVKNLRELTAVVRFLPDGLAFAGHLHIQ
jgi:hypothetical protein